MSKTTEKFIVKDGWTNRQRKHVNSDNIENFHSLRLEERQYKYFFIVFVVILKELNPIYLSCPPDLHSFSFNEISLVYYFRVAQKLIWVY